MLAEVDWESLPAGPRCSAPTGMGVTIIGMGGTLPANTTVRQQRSLCAMKR